MFIRTKSDSIRNIQGEGKVGVCKHGMGLATGQRSCDVREGLQGWIMARERVSIAITLDLNQHC